MKNVKTDLKVGDPVLMKGNALDPDSRELTKVVRIGKFPSLWLEPGQTRWGATVEYETMYINPKAGEAGEPEEIPGKAESSPMLEDQWSFNEADGRWEVQLR